MARHATIIDVARRAGVSPSTASKALNGRDRVHHATRERVAAAADALGYQPNSLARRLREGRTRTVGMLTSDSVGRFSMPVLLGAEDAFGAEEVAVLLCDARGDAIRERHHVRALIEHRVDGLIVVGQRTDPRRPVVVPDGFPVVYAYGRSERDSDMSFAPDDRGGARLAVEHLLSLGRSRLAHVTGPVSYLAARERVAGAQDVLSAAGLPFVGERAYNGDWNEVWGRTAVDIVLRADPHTDGIFCGSDQIARGVCEALRERGVRVPDDIAVIGFDNWDVVVSGCRPPLTTIDLNLEALGRAAARQVFEAIDGDPSSGIVEIPCRLITRESTAPSVTSDSTAHPEA